MTSAAIYRRTGIDPLTIAATRCKSDYEVADNYGLTVKAHSIDFLIDAATLGFEPEAGDVIEAGGRSFEVMNLADEGCWRWSDSYNTTYRIHTKDTGTAE